VISRKLQLIIAALVAAILAMGFYLVHLKHKAESIAVGPATQQLVAPVNGPPAQMTLFVASDDDYSIRPISITSALPSDPGERGRASLHALILRYLAKDSPHPLGPGADVHDVYLLDPASAVVNLNGEFANAHRSGIEVEQLSIFSLVLTLKAQLPQLNRVRFLVDGKTRDTLAGHLDISDWMDIALVSAAAKDLK
jgi:hypothetical protein